MYSGPSFLSSRAWRVAICIAVYSLIRRSGSSKGFVMTGPAPLGILMAVGPPRCWSPTLGDIQFVKKSLGVTNFGNWNSILTLAYFVGVVVCLDVGDGDVCGASHSSRNQSRYHVLIALDKLGSRLATAEPHRSWC